MWFVYVLVGLVLLIVGGLYLRRRVAAALAHLGVGEGRIRVVRWVIAYLLFGFPLIVIISILVALASDSDSFMRFDGYYSALLFAVPFMIATLVVFQSVPWLIAVDLVYLVARRRRTELATKWRLRAVLVVVVAFLLYTPIRILVERGDLRVRHHEVIATGSTPPFRITFIADVQQDDFTDDAYARALYASLAEKRADIVLSGGDWINTGPDHIPAAAAAAGTLTSRLGTFSVRGDHEHFAYFDRERSVSEIEGALREHGVHMIANDIRWFDHHGKRIAVIFLNYNYVQRVAAEKIAALVATAAPADYTIAVTHQLDVPLATLLENQVDLVLAAHTHGGQINPVLGVVHVPLASLETRFVDGRYQLGGTTIIVTAGVGYSLVPFRYASPSSVEIIDLRL